MGTKSKTKTRKPKQAATQNPPVNHPPTPRSCSIKMMEILHHRGEIATHRRHRWQLLSVVSSSLPSALRYDPQHKLLGQFSTRLVTTVEEVDDVDDSPAVKAARALKKKLENSGEHTRPHMPPRRFSMNTMDPKWVTRLEQNVARRSVARYLKQSRAVSSLAAEIPLPPSDARATERRRRRDDRLSGLKRLKELRIQQDEEYAQSLQRQQYEEDTQSILRSQQDAAEDEEKARVAEEMRALLAKRRMRVALKRNYPIPRPRYWVDVNGAPIEIGPAPTKRSSIDPEEKPVVGRKASASKPAAVIDADEAARPVKKPARPSPRDEDKPERTEESSPKIETPQQPKKAAAQTVKTSPKDEGTDFYLKSGILHRRSLNPLTGETLCRILTQGYISARVHIFSLRTH
ncbi:hypothetical protein R3P38DRAFT_2806906 [Favolaschia claudopus]|uniref:Uncharacterized protein n=1 Tax=Favolaschia claudopus TaxID=2862362 RepID=A0AAV9ZJB9_9AGAR